jgi:hypothetical protein
MWSSGAAAAADERGGKADAMVGVHGEGLGGARLSGVGDGTSGVEA